MGLEKERGGEKEGLKLVLQICNQAKSAIDTALQNIPLSISAEKIEEYQKALSFLNEVSQEVRRRFGSFIITLPMNVEETETLFNIEELPDGELKTAITKLNNLLTISCSCSQDSIPNTQTSLLQETSLAYQYLSNSIKNLKAKLKTKVENAERKKTIQNQFIH
jgi:hypothetical protein